MLFVKQVKHSCKIVFSKSDSFKLIPSHCVSITCFTACLLQLMAAMGNEKAKSNYEQFVPAFYKRPKSTDPL